MSINDLVQATLVAVAVIIDGDTELRALFGRTANLVTSFDDLGVEPETPLIVFKPLSTSPHRTNMTTFTIEFSAFAASPSIANDAVSRLETLFATAGATYDAFAALDVRAIPHVTTLPFRQWPGSDAGPDDAAPCRADITISLLLAN